jgi:hypothetical protein
MGKEDIELRYVQRGYSLDDRDLHYCDTYIGRRFSLIYVSMATSPQIAKIVRATWLD